MSLIVKNTKTLITPDNFKLKVLVYGLPSTGKTKFASTAPNPGFAACETGQGNGLLTIAAAGCDYVEPENMQDFQAVADGKVFPDKETLVTDSLSEMVRRFVKDFALQLPRMRGDSPKRKQGIPELDDYQVMGEVTRRYLRKLLAIDKHIIVTATEKYRGPDAETGQGETIIGPDLPGEMFTGSTAMFDFVFRFRTRPRLRDPKDAKSRYTEHYFLTAPDGSGTQAKCRSSFDDKPVLPPEVIFDPKNNIGTFPDVLRMILEGYQK